MMEQIMSCFLLAYVLILTGTPVVLYHTYKLQPEKTQAVPEFLQGSLIGHRASKTGVLENSIASVDEFFTSSIARGIEFDIQMTKDNQVIVFHDTNFVRLCDFNGVVTSKFVKDYTLSEIRNTFKLKNGEDIPTLRDFISHIESKKRRNNRKDVFYVMEIKEYAKIEEIIEEIDDVILENNLLDSSIVGSFNPVVLYLLKKKNPNVHTMLFMKYSLVRDWFGKDHKSLPSNIRSTPWMLKSMFENLAPLADLILRKSGETWLPSFLGVTSIGIDKAFLKHDQFNVESWQKSGYGVNVWVVNEAKSVDKYLKRGMTVSSDNPKILE